MWKKCSLVLGISLFVLIVLALIKSTAVAPIAMDFEKSDAVVVNEQWEKETVVEDGAFLNRYSFRIEQDTSDHLILSVKFLTPHFRVRLNGEVIYDFYNDLNESGAGRHWIVLPPHIAGQELVIEAAQEKPGKIYLASKDTLMLRFVKDNSYALYFGSFALLLGIIVIAVNLYLWKRGLEEGGKGAGHLGAFIVLAGMWILTDSEILQVLTNNTSAIWLCSYLCFIMMPVPLLTFLMSNFRERRRIWIILRHLFVGCSIVCLIVYLLQLAPLNWILPIVHVLFVVTVVTILWRSIVEFRRYRSPELRKILIGFGLLIVFGVMALTAFYTDQANHIYPYLYCIGICLFVFYLLQAAFLRLGYVLKRNADVDAYQRLAHMDALTKLDNRTSFMKEEGSNDDVEQLAYLIMDINDLKMVNDKYGHREGDQLIVDAADCIHEIFSGTGQCFRIGGDEFAVILKELSDQAIQSLIMKFYQKVENMNYRRKVPLSIAVGYAARTDRSKTMQMLYEEADANMYANKKKMKAAALLHHHTSL